MNWFTYHHLWKRESRLRVDYVLVDNRAHGGKVGQKQKKWFGKIPGTRQLYVKLGERNGRVKRRVEEERETIDMKNNRKNERGSGIKE